MEEVGTVQTEGSQQFGLCAELKFGVCPFILFLVSPFKKVSLYIQPFLFGAECVITPLILLSTPLWMLAALAMESVCPLCQKQIFLSIQTLVTTFSHQFHHGKG